MSLQGREVVLGVTGGIAAYKAAEVVSLVSRQVRVSRLRCSMSAALWRNIILRLCR